MESKLENPQDMWSDFEDDVKARGEFFKPEAGVQYRVVVKSVELKKVAFKEGDEKKWRGFIKFSSIDGKPDDRTWETGSFTVLNELKKHDRAGTLGKVVHLLKKNESGGKVTYIFEEIGAA